MRIGLTFGTHAFALAACVLCPLGCSDDPATSGASAQTSSEPDTDAATETTETPDPDPEETGSVDTEDVDTDAADTEGVDTDAVDTETEGPEPPADCSCYDPWIDAAHDVDDECRPASEVFTGCVETSPCDTIVLSGGFGESGGEEAEFEDPEAVVCVARAIASGTAEGFRIRSELFNGSVTSTYLPKPGGGYHRYSCGLVDNPPILASVRTAEPDAKALTTCVATYDSDANITALYACLDSQLESEGNDALACGAD